MAFSRDSPASGSAASSYKHPRPDRADETCSTVCSSQRDPLCRKIRKMIKIGTQTVAKLLFTSSQHLRQFWPQFLRPPHARSGRRGHSQCADSRRQSRPLPPAPPVPGETKSGRGRVVTFFTCSCYPLLHEVLLTFQVPKPNMGILLPFLKIAFGTTLQVILRLG